jgi:hypothetical protein
MGDVATGEVMEVSQGVRELAIDDQVHTEQNILRVNISRPNQDQGVSVYHEES